MLELTSFLSFQLPKKERKDEEKINNNNKQANININNETTPITTTTIKTNNEIAMSNNYTTILSNYNNNSAAIDNINVIYDNDTTVLELQTNDNYDGLNSNANLFSKHKSPSKMNDFINSDRTEEVERENYATCLFEPLGDSRRVGSQMGRLNFWQPINNRGALHVLVRFRYTEYTMNETNSREPVHSIKRRESFRAPIERVPDGINSGPQMNNSIEKKKHQIWLANECKTIHQHDGQLLIEVSPTIESSQPDNGSKVIDFDAELTIAHFNLSGANSIMNKHLIIELPNHHLNSKQVGREFACCQVKQVDTFPITELDNLASISVIQPVREDLLITTSTIAPVVSKKTET